MPDPVNLSDIPDAPAGATGKLAGLYGALARLFDPAPWALSRRVAIRARSGASYTLALEDEGCLVVHTHTSAAVLTIPPASSVAFEPGAQIELQRGNAQITVTAGSGVTLQAAGRPKFRVVQSRALLIYHGSDVWSLSGDCIA